VRRPFMVKYVVFVARVKEAIGASPSLQWLFIDLEKAMACWALPMELNQVVTVAPVLDPTVRDRQFRA
jgi:hypothetical protein